ncbi:hypothetical protein [Thalassotalea piscium]|uniref:Uncharacterized protein n=1 Tax=Thalassotalea piscium TaxID=1230533 RepID=A0A7X0NDV1_9GAMM|nr:hypothetical protein [Thalassotalea piscium]MBB6541623.1 hypothetical protein [Thalassotalea piscium]
MNNIFWNQLLSLSDELDSSNSALQEENIASLIHHLESLCIAHERSFEPADEFEEYVVLSLCRSIANKLKNTP